MIPIEKLRSVRVVVCHAYPERPCPDGVASALLLRSAFNELFDEESIDVEVVFVAHGDQLEALEARPGMLFCDIAPPAARAKEFVEVGAIVLDHHATARPVVELFEHHAFGDEEKEPGVSGAVLAFREVYEPIFRGMNGGRVRGLEPGRARVVYPAYTFMWPCARGCCRFAPAAAGTFYGYRRRWMTKGVSARFVAAGCSDPTVLVFDSKGWVHTCTSTPEDEQTFPNTFTCTHGLSVESAFGIEEAFGMQPSHVLVEKPKDEKDEWDGGRD